MTVSENGTRAKFRWESFFCVSCTRNVFLFDRGETLQILLFITSPFVYAKCYILSELFVSCTQNHYFWGAGAVTSSWPGCALAF